jgi:hypothetical protein
MLRQFFPELIEEERLRGWFQQDSATAHTAHSVHVCLCRLFPLSSGTELSVVIFDQNVHPILILVIVGRTKFTALTPERKN